MLENCGRGEGERGNEETDSDAVEHGRVVEERINERVEEWDAED